jgi:hypothetical protein
MFKNLDWLKFLYVIKTFRFLDLIIISKISLFYKLKPIKLKLSTPNNYNGHLVHAYKIAFGHIQEGGYKWA